LKTVFLVVAFFVLPSFCVGWNEQDLLPVSKRLVEAQKTENVAKLEKAQHSQLICRLRGGHRRIGEETYTSR